MKPILIYNVAWLCPLHYISNHFEEDEINNNNNNINNNNNNNNNNNKKKKSEVMCHQVSFQS
jgi:hypothetical protein